MASFVTITLDTTEPGGVTLSIDGGALYATDVDVLLSIGTTDPDTTGYQMKIWGDVDEADNANIQQDEADSSWIAYSASQAIKLSTGDGSKSISVKLRDDVHNPNAAAVTDTITLDTTVPVVTVMDGPDPAKISKQPTKDVSTIVWQSSQQYDEYKVKVVPNGSSIHSAGTLIPDTGGSTNVSGSTPNQPATTNVTTEINGEDLETAAGDDGDWVVKVFVKDDAGNWSL